MVFEPECGIGIREMNWMVLMAKSSGQLFLLKRLVLSFHTDSYPFNRTVTVVVTVVFCISSGTHLGLQVRVHSNNLGGSLLLTVGTTTM